ncbi:D-alanyl-D-alanine carboxypeptidase family protein [Schumannella sp. 10F1B-5-1]|uniref:D-alanyl-D-alanine carboxypeptidase family protein n=1 Tax=Schumannella sp. 10F1B-5-1 TaxID=2590780 RepID=UPI0011307643|nr:D-alanyl-D-alanine carboxypeptidase [Schumannella sp. 10F1B-5-1]TPW72328.1 D-alanyl-D-alanine carboxypeptidase [Schumannella sp. 10F1B-5-1]
MPHDDLDRLDWMMRRAEQRDPGSAADHGDDPAEPGRRRRRRRRQVIGAVVAIAVIAALVGGYVSAALNAPLALPKGVVTAPKPEPGGAVAWPAVRGEFAVSVSGADEFLGPDAAGVFQAGGGDAAKPMASISKLVTALVVLDRKPLGSSGTGPTITFDKAAHDLYDKYYLLNATIAPMPTGTQMSEHDAIETMLVASASNYAEAVSTWAFGSQSAFLSAARSWLKKQGLNATTFSEPTGLDARNTSTPSDLIALGRLVKADAALTAIVAKTGLDFAPVQGFSNTNPLLGVDGVDGIKTGTLEDYGTNLLFSATVPVTGVDQPLTVIGVVLGSNRDQIVADVRDWLGALQAGFHSVPLAAKGEVVGSYRTAWGAKAEMVLDGGANIVTWSDAPITAKLTTTALKTGRDGEKVGTVTYTAGARSETVPVVLQGGIRQPDAWWRLSHPGEVLGW